MENKHAVIPVTADENDKNQWKTIYESIDNKINSRKVKTYYFLQKFNANINKPRNVQDQSKKNIETTSL